MILRPLTLLLACTFLGCGLAEGDQDERNKFIYITFSDPAFEAYCLGAFDLNQDGRISRYEAQRVREIVCPGRGIASLYEIGEFSNLERLVCSGNFIADLDLRRCTLLQTVDCSSNVLTSLDVDGLRGLTSLNCFNNKLPSLDLRSNASISMLNCSSNRLSTLDVSTCFRTMEIVDATSNPSLSTFYLLAGQTIRSLRLDGGVRIVER